MLMLYGSMLYIAGNYVTYLTNPRIWVIHDNNTMYNNQYYLHLDTIKQGELSYAII